MGKAARLAEMYGSGGPGSPVSLMTNHVKKLVVRYRQVRLFPLEPSDFFQSVFPAELFYERNANDPRWANLAKAINVEPVGHFHVEGRDYTHETFWVRAPDPIPAPSDLSLTLEFAKSNTHFATVNAWVGEALEVHDKIESALEELRMFIASVQHPEHVQNFWPEMVPFIGQYPDTVWNQKVKVRGRDLSIPTKARQEWITDLLATCSLLPDAEPVAWVKFPERVL